MMEDKNDVGEKMEEVMLPGFRFHPTDEELISFYLRRKVQQRPLSIELIRQLDIYKYDPWDLPKFAMTGEKEWYFYCPRDRKYRNSARPNRVTGAGFWKATGTDRPIYSSEGHKCIGLKKSLVFYKGRAAKGIKTDWMMHEFRLPSLSDPSASSATLFDKAVPPNDSWAICRIFKKTNATAQRALSHSYVSSLPPESSTVNNNTLNKTSSLNTIQFCSDKNPKTNSHHHENIKNPRQPYSDDTITTSPFPYFDFTSYHKPINFANPLSTCLDQQDLTSFLLAPQETQSQFHKFSANDISSFLLNMSSGSSVLGDYANHLECSNINFGAVLAQEQCPALVSLPQEYKERGAENCSSSNDQMKNMGGGADDEDHHYWETIRSLGFAFGDYSEAETVGDHQHHHHQDLKQNILLENCYWSSSIDGDLPAVCFSTTKCFT